MNLDFIYLDNETGHNLATAFVNDFIVEFQAPVTIYTNQYINLLLEKEPSSAIRVINAPQAIKNALDQDTCFEFLSLNNISFTQDAEVQKSYQVLMMGLDCISIKVTAYEKSKGKTYYIQEKDNKKVVEIARRAIYSLGLDFGLAEIVFTAKRMYKVRSIDPSPDMREEDVEKVKQKIIEISELDRYVENQEVCLGADPEFMLINSKNGKMISASDHFPREGLVGCDNIRIPNRQQRPVAEIRPKPSVSPHELLENIRSALLSAHRMAPYKNVKWIAGSLPTEGYTIGGHIHFSDTKLNASILKAFDNYLAIPLFLIENPNSALKRRRKNGSLCDYRLKDYGGFEYRTLGSWLVSPHITLATLCLAKIVSSRYHLLQHNYLSLLEAQKAFYQGEQSYFQSLFPKLWRDIEALDLYPFYKDDLKIIKTMIAEQVNWDESSDFRKAWQMPFNELKKNQPEENKNVTVRVYGERSLVNNSYSSNSMNQSSHHTLRGTAGLATGGITSGRSRNRGAAVSSGQRSSISVSQNHSRSNRTVPRGSIGARSSIRIR